MFYYYKQILNAICMKRLTQIFISGMVGVALLSCNKNNDNANIKDGILTIKDISHSECKSHDAKAAADNSEYLEYSTVDGNYLLIKHVNVRLNCCPDSIKVNSSIDNGIIKYFVFEKNPGCNCICLYDVTCKIGPLAYALYPIKVIVGPEQVAEFNLIFNRHTNGKFIIKNLSR